MASSSNYDSMIERLSEPLAWSARTESTLLEPFTYVAATGGKQVRSHLIDAFNLWLNVPAPRVELISKVVSMLHNASLLIDDVEDNSQLRRGSPVAHKIYGVPLTINSANYVYFLAFQELFKLKVILKEDADLLPSKQIESIDQMVTEELLNLHRGQGLDVFWRDSLTCPTEEEYIQMVNGKTGGLLRIGIKLLMLSSKSEVDYVPLVNLIGIYFQIRDDYMNLQSTEYSDNKGYCEDLTEGKFSFPVVHSIRADESNRQVLNVLQKRPTTPTIKRHIVGYMDTATQSFAYTRSVLATLEKQAYAEVERLGGNKKLEKILERLHVNEETKAE